LSASAASLGLAFLERVGMERISAHVAECTAALLKSLTTLRHWNGQPKVQIYGPNGADQRGGTVAFNLLDPHGAVIDYEHVLERAARADISLRGGCFCNPGAAEHAFGYTTEELSSGLERCREPFSHAALRECLNGKPVGALRASLGYGSAPRDIDALIALLGDMEIR
jgi:selenocysteine lyase/cysteine desulfurase